MAAARNRAAEVAPPVVADAADETAPAVQDATSDSQEPAGPVDVDPFNAIEDPRAAALAKLTEFVDPATQDVDTPTRVAPPVVVVPTGHTVAQGGDVPYLVIAAVYPRAPHARAYRGDVVTVEDNDLTAEHIRLGYLRPE
ncbi:hypothetical protein D1871_11085 [Nakamurella silvestris]|nr:hypothetical protein D1871_11085 [Nakamurella silvestris]